MNIHGYCPHCKADLDGKLIIQVAIDMGKTQEEALKYAANYEGWEKYGELNKFSRVVAIYDIFKDRTTSYRCPDCKGVFK
jgi:hypothetical protein